MEIEWIAHNLLYDYEIETKRTDNVDLNNNDEEKYRNYFNIINELFKEIKSEANCLKKVKTK